MPPSPTTSKRKARTGSAPAPKDAEGRELHTRGRRTRQRLLDAGREVFANKGYHAARVDDIVEVADTSHGTFYLYFSNKEDLFRALVHEVAERLGELTQQLEPIGPDEQGLEVLRSWIGQFAELYDRYGTVIRTWTEAEADDTEIGQIGAEVLGQITRSLAEHVTPALPEDVRGDVAVLALVAMVERVNYFVHSRQIRASRAAVVETLAAITHAALFGSTR